jgi:pimeloyl-ACP methyl ester carboxylesterase
MAARATLAAAIALALVLGAVPPAGAALKLHRCDLGAARPLRCGQIETPMRRGDPSLGTTEVAFAVRPRGDRSRPSLGTILATDGGPGYGSTAAPFVRSVNAALAPLLRRREIVYVDARGTGRSDALNCRTLQRGLILESTAIGECANQLGPRFAGYTTGETADDLDAVREALGLGRVFYYGDSYGTLLGQAFAVRHPGSLRGLILDSAYPADDPYYRTLLPAGLNGLEIACRRAPDCSGDAIGRYSRVVRRFHSQGRPTDNLLSFLLQSGTLAPRSYLSLDEGDRRYLAGDPRRLNGLIAPGIPGHGSIREFTYGLEITVECNDYPLLWNPYSSIDARIRQLSTSVKRIPADSFAPFGAREYLLSPASHLTNCLTWPAPPPGGLEPPVPAGWRAPTSFPTLILSGEVDDITSVTEAKQVKRRFPRSTLSITPDRGHVSSLYFPFRSPAVGVIQRFIRTN